MKAQHFEFNESMNEVSGCGGAHERACRLAVCRGAEWFLAHRTAHPEFGAFAASDGRMTPVNVDAHGLLAAIEDADFVRDDGVHVPLAEALSGEMTQIILFHVLYIAKHGWNNYVAKMSAPMSLIDAAGESP